MPIDPVPQAMTSPQIVWLRRDLRLADQPALYAAAQSGPVIPVYILDDKSAGDHAYGGASRWWLHHSLKNLADDLERRGSRLVLRRGNAVEILCQLAQDTGAQVLHAIRHYEPWWCEAEESLAAKLAGECGLCLHEGNYLMPPGMVTTASGEAYKIYSPFARAMLAHFPPRDPLQEPPTLPAPQSWPESDRLGDWGLHPERPDWSNGLAAFWDVGEPAAQRRLKEWGKEVAHYSTKRDFPSIKGSSRLSPHLHFGEISPAQIWHQLAGKGGEGWTGFEKELIWRDYAQNVINQFPDYSRESYRKGYGMLWRQAEGDPSVRRDLVAWQKGMTGYPIVDAGMRQLWRTGWMHNRVRMLTASFLVKHLLIDWRVGEQWFWNTLVDADYANNGVNWQWVSGTGVDSNMFVRIMAPLRQSEKFDAAGYIREYVPELAGVPDAQIHDPPAQIRGAYPAPIVGHREARERALAAYRSAKES